MKLYAFKFTNDTNSNKKLTFIVSKTLIPFSKIYINHINFILDFLASGRDENVTNNVPAFVRPDHPKAMNHFRRRSRHQFNDAVSVCSSHKSSTSRQAIFNAFRAYIAISG